MTTLDSLTAVLGHLFLRVDAAQPTDPVLSAAADFWKQQRKGKVMPAHTDMASLPAFVLPHAFYAKLAINGDEHWIVSTAGSSAKLSLGLEGHEPQQVPDKRMAVRLRSLFDLVAQRAEPYSVMFELPAEDGAKLLVEIFAAPLTTPEPTERQVFAVLNYRPERN